MYHHHHHHHLTNLTQDSALVSHLLVFWPGRKRQKHFDFLISKLYCCRRSLRFWGISSDSSRTGILDTLHSTHFGFIWNVSHCASTSFTCHFNNNSLTSLHPGCLTWLHPDFKYSSTRFQSRFVLKRWCTPYKIYSNKSINSFRYFLFLGVFFYFFFALMWEHLAKRKKEMLL